MKQTEQKETAVTEAATRASLWQVDAEKNIMSTSII